MRMAAKDGSAADLISFDTPHHFGKGDWAAEMDAMKMEMDRLRRLKQEERRALSAENDLLQRRLDDARTQMRVMNEALTHATVRYNMALNTNRQHKEDLTQRLENERKSREKLQTEVDLLNRELRSALVDLEKVQAASSKQEKHSEGEKEKWLDLAEERARELEIARIMNLELMEKLNGSIDHLSKTTTELRLLKMMMEDRENKLVRCQKDLEQRSCQLDHFTEQYRNQKEENIRLQVKVESLQDRIKDSQNVTMSMQRRLTEEQEKNRRSDEKILRLTSSSAEYDRLKSNLEEKIREQKETIEGLKDDVRFAQNRRELTLDELRSAQDIWANRQSEVTTLRLALESANSSKFGLEAELLDTKRLVERQSKKLEDVQKRNTELQQKLSSVSKPESVETLGRTAKETFSYVLYDSKMEDQEQCSPFDDAHSVGKYVAEEDGRRLNDGNVWLSAAAAVEEDSKKNAGMQKAQSRNSDLRQPEFKLSLTEVKEAVFKLDEVQQRNIALSKNVTSVKEQLKKAKKKIKELEQSMTKKKSGVGNKDESTIRQLEIQCHSYKKALASEIDAKLKIEQELTNCKSDAQRIYVQKSEIASVVNKVKAFSQAEVSARMEEVSAYLKEQMRAKETLERLRSSNELEIRKCHVKEREELQCELARMRKSNVQLIAEKGSLELEVMKLQRIQLQGGREANDALYALSPRTMQVICEKTKSHNGDNGGVGCCRVQENGDAEDNRLCHRADGGGGRGGCSRGERGGGVKNCSLLPLASCDSFAQKVALDLDRSIAKHLEKPGQLDGTTGSCGH